MDNCYFVYCNVNGHKIYGQCCETQQKAYALRRTLNMLTNLKWRMEKSILSV